MLVVIRQGNPAADKIIDISALIAHGHGKMSLRPTVIRVAGLFMSGDLVYNLWSLEIRIKGANYVEKYNLSIEDDWQTKLVSWM